jgi:DNA repair protein RadA/Sms
LKVKSKFVCQECGYIALRWLGRCPECGVWNSLEEEVEQSLPRSVQKRALTRPQLLSEIENQAVARLDLGSRELNRVLGGGLVLGSIVLLAGDPGIGKSTLLLQVADYVARQGNTVLYISGEESVEQIKMRASRLGLEAARLYLWSETDLGLIEQEIGKIKPALIIIDSIQTVFCAELTSTMGSISQIKVATSRLGALAKEFNVPLLIVGHVTKEGGIAGPRVLEHMVDTVLYFEGERQHQYRILRSIKNRFGSTFELGVWEMRNSGLQEILNPSQAFLAERPQASPGSVVAASIEGTRPLLVEIQALVSQSVFGHPRRVATGVDYNRVNLLMAVLEKRVGLNLSQQDAYVNVVGGIKVQEPALDLAIAIALASSLKNRPTLPHLVLMGEVGLTGEIRSISFLEKRLREAEKLGFTHCLVPQGKKIAELRKQKKGLELMAAKTLKEAVELVLM